MTLETTSFAEGAIEVTFLQQQGRDPFIAPPERTAQIKDVADQNCPIHSVKRDQRSTSQSTTFDFMTRRRRLLRTNCASQARKGVRIRIAYDNATNPGADVIPTAAPSQLESDQRPIGADSFVRSFVDVAQVKGITGYRVLMHNKYILRDIDTPDAAVFTGSSNYTNNPWGLQDNNLLCLRSQQLASYYAKDFTDLWSRGKIVELDWLSRHRHRPLE